MSGRLLTGPRFGLSGGRGGFRTLVTDTFTRTDTTGPLGTADSGQAWETIAGTAFGITSNAAYNTDTANTLCISTIDSATCNGRVACTVTRTTQVAGLVVRLTDASNYWYVSLSGSATTLNKMVAGSPTTVATSASTFSGATAVEVVMSGSNFTVLVNNAVLLTGTDSFNATATKHGIMRQQALNNSRHDNFTVKQASANSAPISRATFLSGMSTILGANQRVLYVPNGTDTTSSVESSTVGRTITWDATIAARAVVTGNAYSQTFNGTNQWGDMVDAADLSFGNGTTDQAFSILVLANASALAGEVTLAAKWAAGLQEYRFTLDATGLARMFMQDASAGAAIEARSAAGAATAGTWGLFGMSYDGTGGASAANGAAVYANGVDVTASRTNSGSYVAMEDLAVAFSIATRNAHTATFFPGSIAMVAVTQKALTASEHAQAATLCRRTFGVPL